MKKINIAKGAIVTFCIILTQFSLPMTAQQQLFTLEDLNFGGTNYHNLRPKRLFLTWWGDELMRQDAEAAYKYDKKSKKESVVFTLDNLGSDFHSLMSVSYPYAEQPLALIRNSKERILFNFKKKNVEWRQTCEGEQNSSWNSASKAVAYTRNNQLFVRTADNVEHQLSTDGSREIVYGEAVHRNEFGINGGLFWSANGQRLAFYRMDQTMVTDYPQVNIDTRVAELEPDKYPMAGMNAHKVTIGIYDLKTQKTIYLNTPEASTDADCLNDFIYLTNITFSPDGEKVFVFELNRDQNDCRLVSYNATTGEKIAEHYRETSNKYVEPMHPIRFLPWDSHKAIMQSEKDGFNHIYLIDFDCNDKEKAITPITSGNWVVLDVLGFNKTEQSVIYASNEIHPLQKNLFSVNLNTCKRKCLSTTEGVHNGRLSASGSQVVDYYSTPTEPLIIERIAASGKNNTARKTAVELLRADNPWKDYIVPQFESGCIKAADNTTDLYYRMVKPADFDPNKKYPTIIYVYGGPHAHLVDASWHWSSRSWETYMAQKGYILFILDSRGSENRGKAFEQVTFRQLGQIEMEDQMKGVDFLRTLPYVDMSRLGVHGWSFGGFMTMSLMLNHPDVFKVGVAGGPVIDWKWYEVMYGERYMDTPQQNPEGYAKTSLISKAGNLKGKLQIIIGNNDPTVVPQHALSFLKACAETGAQPDFYVYPGEGHNMMGHNSVHLHERITQYFEDYLK